MVLEVESLSYAYPKSKVETLHELCFSIAEGEIVGFLGPNGAGKTTTQKILTGILSGYKGEVSVFGKDLRSLGSDYYNRIGVCFEFPNLYNKLTAEENLNFYRRFFDVPTADPAELLARFDLPVNDKRTVGQYSKGMKMRLTLLRSLLNNPRLWFLDEPTTGQDPQHSVMIRDMIRARRDKGTSVFLTTHNMTLADELSDRVAFIVDGKIVAFDTPRSLKIAHAKRVVRVEYRDNGHLKAKDFSLEDESGKADFIELVKASDIETIHTMEPSLEDVFIKLTGRGLAL